MTLYTIQRHGQILWRFTTTNRDELHTIVRYYALEGDTPTIVTLDAKLRAADADADQRGME